MSGISILFEGVDGSGKSFALDHLRKYYEDQNKSVVVASSISTTDFRKSFDPNWYDINNKANQYAQYVTYEVNNYYKNIKPALDQDKIVLIDRYLPSCFAYNELPGDQYDSFLINLIANACEKFFVPTVTFIFDVSDSVLLERFEKHRQHEGIPNLEFVNKVRNGYDSFTTLYGKFAHNNTTIGSWDIHKINSNKPINEIVTEMVHIIDSLTITGVRCQ